MGLSTPYRLAADTFDREEIDAAKAVLDSGCVTMGEQVAAFEQEFAAWTGSKHALMVNSGSSANLLMVDALLRRSRAKAPLSPGDEVLVPALSWPTTVWPLTQLGLVPVFVDVDRETLAIDLESARGALSPKTRGMFLIHVLGQVPNMQAYVEFCETHGLTLIEDACESLGAHHGKKHAGEFGAMGSFSCYFSHHISTIEGGVIVTSDSALQDDLKSLRAHGWVRDRSDREYWRTTHPELDERFMFIMPGYNVRPTEIQGAIGRVQLRKLDQMLHARERLALTVNGWAKRFSPWMSLIGEALLPPSDTALERRERRHSWMTLPFRLADNAPLSVERLKNHFQTRGVDTRPIIAGNLARHPAIAGIESRNAASLEQADELLRKGFMIGCHPKVDRSALETLERAFESLAAL